MNRSVDRQATFRALVTALRAGSASAFVHDALEFDEPAACLVTSSALRDDELLGRIPVAMVRAECQSNPGIE